MILRWIKKWKLIVADTVTGLGLFWLAVEMSSYMTSGVVDHLFKEPWFALPIMVLIFIIAILKNKPKTSFSSRIRKKDNFIEVKVGDAFKNKGALIVPINDHFDLTLGGNVAKANSLQNKLICDYYGGRHEHLEADIKDKVSQNTENPIGTTVEVENNNKRFYLLANSHKLENNRVKASIDDLITSLASVWDFIGNESGRNKYVTIPLVNSGHGRNASLTKMTTAKEIIDSYIEANKQINVCERLIIAIHPDDIKNGLVNLDELQEYLNAACNHYKQVIMAPKENGDNVPSQVIAIDN
ncbi:MAG: hypothetical protein H6779_02510 [Candidatus Nomurabacteria bacterium]|nr:hypothetical protein [Candidatus Nomurabacteria bacterium]USN87261.1 MAG: hypothetical protein H6779_02510 [Candidatus Nomurabacteria bacterium]